MKLRKPICAFRSELTRIEPLEARFAPAGIITATFVGGVLTLTGDAASNDIDLTFPGQDTTDITGNGGTQIALNGAPAAGSVSLVGAIKALNGTLGNGDDRVGLNIITLGSISLDGGDGNDSLILANSVATGAVKFVGGNNDDAFVGTSTLFKVGGTLTLDMGDGTNAVQLVAGSNEVGGAFTISGGTGADNVTLAGASLLASKGLTAKLGDGDNAFLVQSQDARFMGPVSVSHLDRPGTAATTFSVPGTLAIKGGLTVSYGNGSSNTEVTAGSSMDISGAIKVNSTGGTDSFGLGSSALATIKGGVNVDLGGGDNAFALNGTNLATSSLTFTGAGGADVFTANLNSLRTGAVTVNFGGGTNAVNLSATEIAVSGLLKVTTGAGDDIFEINSTEARFAKGITYTAGDGVNSLNTTVKSFASGPINIAYGAHAAGTSTVVINNSVTKISGVVNFTSAAGKDSFVVNGPSFTSGPITAKMGDGNSIFDLSAGTIRTGAVAVTTGTGDDAVKINGADIVLAGLKAELGEGINTLSGGGGSLTVSGAASLLTGNGDDMLDLTHQNIKLKGFSAKVGDGLFTGTVAGVAVQISGPFTLLAGDHTAGTSVMSIGGGSLLTLGPVNATFGSGDNGLGISAQAVGQIGAVKYLGKGGVDTFGTIIGTSGVLGAVSFDGGDGANQVTVNVVNGKAAGVKYLGGNGVDALAATAPLGTIGAITADFGSGDYLANFSGSGQTLFTGAINVIAANQAGQAGTLALRDATFKGAINLKTGDGVEVLNFIDLVATSAFKVDTAGGDDVVNIETTTGDIASTFGGPVTILTGAGADVLSIGNNTATGKAQFKGTVKLDGGADADVANVSAAIYGNTYIAGQPVLVSFEAQN